MRSGFWLIAFVLLNLMAGCTLPEVPALPAQERAALEHVAIVPVHSGPEISLDLTRGTGQAIAHGAANGAVVPVYVASKIGSDPVTSDTLTIMLAGVALMPVGAVAGAVYGGVVSQPGPEVDRTAEPIRAYLQGTELQRGFAREVSLLANMRGASIRVVAGLQGSTSLEQPGDYRGIKGGDTVLEVGLSKIRLVDYSVSNNMVFLQLKGFARLIRVADGRILLNKEYPYESFGHTLIDWQDQDARLVQDELANGSARIADHIVNDFLLGALLLEGRFESLSPQSLSPFKGHFWFNPQPTLCWKPFPAAQDLAGDQGEFFGRAKEVVYDLKVLSADVSYPGYAREGLADACHHLETPLKQPNSPSQWYSVQLRARFKVEGRPWQTPWVTPSSTDVFWYGSSLLMYETSSPQK